MPIVKTTVSKEVQDEILKAEGMHNFILASVPSRILTDTDVKILVVALFSLTLEHHGAILHLLKAGQFDGSALALVRPLVEGTYRAHWIYACAKPEIVLRIKNGEDAVYPGLINMATEVEKKSDAGGIFAAVTPYIHALHGYTHGGIEQLGRRFDPAGDVRPNYADGEKLEAIRSTTGYITALAIAWCQLISTDAPDKEPHSKAISDRYVELYQAPSTQAQ